jgi:hypothetical protein
VQLVVLENVHVLPAVTAMLVSAHTAPAALQLLQVLVSSRREVQQLVVGQPGLLQGLLAWIKGEGRDAAAVQQVLRQLRLLVQGNRSGQLALAQVPGACAALLETLGSGDAEVGNEAAETLAVLQQGNAAVQALVKQVAQRVSLQLT